MILQQIFLVEKVAQKMTFQTRAKPALARRRGSIASHLPEDRKIIGSNPARMYVRTLYIDTLPLVTRFHCIPACMFS
jgi:hypothetical protein